MFFDEEGGMDEPPSPLPARMMAPAPAKTALSEQGCGSCGVPVLYSSFSQLALRSTGAEFPKALLLWTPDELQLPALATRDADAYYEHLLLRLRSTGAVAVHCDKNHPLLKLGGAQPPQVGKEAAVAQEAAREAIAARAGLSGAAVHTTREGKASSASVVSSPSPPQPTNKEAASEAGGVSLVSLVQRMHEAGYPVHVYTVNDHAEATDLIQNHGVDAVFSDYCLPITV